MLTLLGIKANTMYTEKEKLLANIRKWTQEILYTVNKFLKWKAACTI